MVVLDLDRGPGLIHPVLLKPILGRCVHCSGWTLRVRDWVTLQILKTTDRIATVDRSPVQTVCRLHPLVGSNVANHLTSDHHMAHMGQP
jgi:hypothetical protein